MQLPKEEVQLINERMYSRKFIDQYIQKAITGSMGLLDKIEAGVQLLETYRTTTYAYESKNVRMAQLQDLDLEKLVLTVFTGMAYCQQPTLFTSMAAQLAGRLGFAEKIEGITTMAEIIAVLCETDVYDIIMGGSGVSMMLESNMTLSDQLLGFIQQSAYLPPMVCVPQEVQSNLDSGYLSHNDSLILGKGNSHDGDICLDVINIANRTALKVDTQFLSTVEEEPTFDVNAIKDQHIKTRAQILKEQQMKIDGWDNFKATSYQFYTLMAKQGNQFYFTHKVDKRGRLYSQGYHLDLQGNAFKKATLELANEEVITGVPTL